MFVVVEAVSCQLAPPARPSLVLTSTAVSVSFSERKNYLDKHKAAAVWNAAEVAGLKLGPVPL